MKQKDVILYASLAGGAYLAYWYITNYGPTGQVSAGHASYWDTWFGNTATVTTTTGTTAVVKTDTPPAKTPAQIAADIAAANKAAATVSLRDQMLSAAGKSATDQLTGDQWNYYRNTFAPPAWTPDQMASAFPNGAGSQLMTVDQFLAAAKSAGLAGIGMGAIVPTQSMSSVPSMTFGGSLKTNLMSGMMHSDMKGPVN